MTNLKRFPAHDFRSLLFRGSGKIVGGMKTTFVFLIEGRDSGFHKNPDGLLNCRPLIITNCLPFADF